MINAADLLKSYIWEPLAKLEQAHALQSPYRNYANCIHGRLQQGGITGLLSHEHRSSGHLQEHFVLP